MNLYGGLKRLTIGICLTSIIVGIILMVKLKPKYEGLPRHWSQYLMGQNTTSLVNPDKACRIPKIPIWPEFMENGWKISKNPDCSKRRNLAQINDTEQLLRVFPNYSNSTCCLSQIFRIDKNDSIFNITNCTKIRDRIVNVSEMEFLVIKCGQKSSNHVHYLANIPMKPKVQFKIDAWKKKEKSGNLPLNIFMIGIDTVSRSHAYRSIPKTLDLMKRMGFHDFLGYHSLTPTTLTNFMGFLMGLTQKTVRTGCAPNWKSPFDSCPLIWKNFSRNDYVTMYSEDVFGALNWGGQAGFHSQPTDYYLHQLFLASRKTSWLCTSSESNSQFALRYTKRFIQKFQQTPFFAFTWLAYPFHDDRYSLGNIENDIFEFFESLKFIPGFLERTLIVFLSDHGWRMHYSAESKSGIEAYIEKGLPPLFIRFPELLKKRHPELELDSILEHNVNSLLTPFDLHHTFLHILTLDGENTTEFEPIRPDRQSLLTRMDSENRNCESVNINPGSCVCNINIDFSEDQLRRNPYLREMLMNTLEKELNRIVASSNYSAVCAKWVMRKEWMSSVQILDETSNHSDFHVRFSADQRTPDSRQGIAKFEAKFRVRNTLNRTNIEKSFKDYNLIGKISRVSLYGNQSWCVGFTTDKDKEMKEFCLCK